MSVGGPYQWPPGLKVLTSPPIIDGREMDVQADWAATRPGTPPGIATAGGTSLAQVVVGHPLAARGAAEESFTLAARAHDSGDWEHLDRIATSIRPVTFFAEWQVADVWRITTPPGETTRTRFVLSRSIPYDQFTSTRYPVKAYVEDVPGTPTPTPAVELTPIPVGTPAPGEILVAEGVEVTEVETSDLAASEGVWRQLVLRYYPVRLVTISNLSRNWPAGDGLTWSMDITGFLRARSY